MTAHSVTLFSQLLLLHIVQSQYVDIWYDDMNANNGWYIHNDVSLPRTSARCFDGDCAQINAYNGDSWILKSTNISVYSHIQIQFDLSGNGLEGSDSCQVWYGYDSNSLTQSGGNFSNGRYNNEILTFPPPAPTTTNIRIRLVTHGDSTKSTDSCYFDNVYLRGIVRTLNSTETPSYSPTSNPYINPFNYLCDYDNRFSVLRGVWSYDEFNCRIEQSLGYSAESNSMISWLGDIDSTSMDWTDYEIEIVVNVQSGEEAGLIFRAHAEFAYYSCTVNPTDGVICGVINPRWTMLNTQQTQIDYNTDTTLRIEAVSASFAVYVNNEYFFTMNHGVFSSGSIGLMTWQGTAIYKSVRITFPNNTYSPMTTYRPTTTYSPTTIYNPTNQPITYSQYVDIWYDDMSANNDWSIHNDVSLPRTSARCFDGDCAKINAYYGDSWIEKETNIAAYSHIQIQFDLYGDGLEGSDSCQVWYGYDNNSLTQFGGNFANGLYDNEILTFPSPAPTTINIHIRLVTHGDSIQSHDSCYFDNVYLRGIVRTLNSTETPSYSPITTYNPTNPPTIYSQTTTYNPTAFPTKPSTDITSLFSTLFPTMSPTKNPTKNPTYFVTMKSTSFPNSIYVLPAIFFLFFFIFLGCIHKTCSSKSCCQNNTMYTYPFHSVDYLKTGKILSYGLQLIDIYTDLLFIYGILKKQINFINTIMASLSITFILLPRVVNVILLFQIRKSNILNEFVEKWMRTINIKFFIFLLLLSGSLYHTFAFSACRAFGLRQFLAPLHYGDYGELLSFKIKYFILMETVPQILIQTAWIIFFSDRDFVIIISILISILTFLSSIIEYIFKQKYHNYNIQTMRPFQIIVKLSSDKDVDGDIKQIKHKQYHHFGVKIAVSKLLQSDFKHCDVVKVTFDDGKNELFINGVVSTSDSHTFNKNTNGKFIQQMGKLYGLSTEKLSMHKIDIVKEQNVGIGGGVGGEDNKAVIINNGFEVDPTAVAEIFKFIKNVETLYADKYENTMSSKINL